MIEQLAAMKDQGGSEQDRRVAKYNFGPKFFDLKQIGTKLIFSVGDKEVKGFRMIERHYFKDKLI